MPGGHGDGEATPILPWCPGPALPRRPVPRSITSTFLHAGARSVQGCPMDASPPCPQPLVCGVGVSRHPPSWARGVNHGDVPGRDGAALPFPPKFCVLAEAEHYLPRPSEAAARGCAPSAYLYRCKRYTPEIPSFDITGRSLLWSRDLFLSLSTGSGEPVPGQTLPWDILARTSALRVTLPCGQRDPLQHRDRCDSLGLWGCVAHLRAPARPVLPGLQHRAAQEAEGTRWGAGNPLSSPSLRDTGE